MSNGISRRGLLAGTTAWGLFGLGAGPAAADVFRPHGLGPKGARHDGYVLACGEMAGAHHSAGAALQALSKAKESVDTVVRLALRVTKGSRESLDLLAEDKADFAIVHGVWERWAAQGKGPWTAPLAGLRSIATLWPVVEHVAIRASHLQGGTVHDLERLAGLPFAVGRRDADSETTGRLLVDHLMPPAGGAARPNLLTMGATHAVVAMAEGKVEGFIIPGPLPHDPVAEAFIRMGPQVALLDAGPAFQALADAGLGAWSRHVIPAGTYPGQDRPVESLAQPVTLLARADLDPWAVQRLTAVIYDNLAFLAGLHRNARAMSLDNALGGLSIPLHPGALAYYRERGLSVPEHLAG